MVAGVVLALAFQLLFTNLGIAADISLAVAAAVKKELGMAIDPASMRENVEDFLPKKA